MLFLVWLTSAVGFKGLPVEILFLLTHELQPTMLCQRVICYHSNNLQSLS